MRPAVFFFVLLLATHPARAELLEFVEVQFLPGSQASSVATSSDGAHVYATTGRGDSLVGLARAVGGELSLVQQIVDGDPVDGGGTVDGLTTAAQVALSPDGAHVYVASPSDNALSVFSRNPVSGELSFVEVVRDDDEQMVGDPPQTVTVDGLLGAHFVTVSRDGHNVYAAGSSENALAVFRRNRASGQLLFEQVVRDGDPGGVDGLDGVVGIALGADGNYLYATGHRDDAVAVFQRSAQTGQLTFVQVVRDGDPGGVDGLAGASAVVVSPDGSNVYVTSLQRDPRPGDDALAVFTRDPFSGLLSFEEAHFDDQGGVDGLSQASSVVVDPEGSHVYVASVRDNAVAAFAREPSQGRLTFVEAVFDGDEQLVGDPPQTVTVDGLEAARFVATSPDGAHLYVASLFDGGAIAVFAPARVGLCSDGVDNDGDGLADWPADWGCDDANDASERSADLPCDDGEDNDGDGGVDFDPVTAADSTGLAGVGDAGCRDPNWAFEDPQCQDGINNDPGQDPDPGLIDFDGGLSALGYVVSDPDPQCVGLAWKNKEKTACGLGSFELALVLPGLMWLHRRRKGLH
jgi:6-phosphogluconolactonase (cycloisomerase 2 family)